MGGLIRLALLTLAPLSLRLRGFGASGCLVMTLFFSVMGLLRAFGMLRAPGLLFMALLPLVGPRLAGCSGPPGLPSNGPLIVAWIWTCDVTRLRLFKTLLSRLCAGGGGDTLSFGIRVLGKGKAGMERIFCL